MSARLAVWRVGFWRRTEARVAQAGAPRVLPPRWIVVIVVEEIRGVRWGVMESAVSRRRDSVESVKRVCVSKYWSSWGLLDDSQSGSAIVMTRRGLEWLLLR